MKEITFGVLGGLAFFIYGMNLMSDGLKKAAGERMRRILETLTSNPIMGVIVGALVTAVFQSSSATTVMMVGFVNARLMTLPQAIGVIMGANIGTTVTAQLIAFKFGNYAYLIAAIGFVFFFFFKRKNIKYLGQIIFGFGILFVGLNIMSDVLKPLAGNPIFTNWILNLGHMPIVGVLIGTIMTVVIQSSSATIGVLQSLASQPIVEDGVIKALIPLKTAAPILFGDNIGTTITAWLATIGANKSSKRAALVHTLFNMLGTLVALSLLPAFINFVISVSPRVTAEFNEAMAIKRLIANAHTSFNIMNTVLWLPFVGFLAWVVKKILPGEEQAVERGAKYLDRHMLDNPAVALDLSTKELVRMAEFSRDMLEKVKVTFITGNTGKINQIREIEEILDELQQEVIHYMSTLVSQVSISEKDSQRMADLMHVAGDIERIGDHCLNIVELTQFNNNERIHFSEQAIQEVDGVFNLALEMLDDCISALAEDNFSGAHQVLQLEKRMDLLEEQLRMNHIERLNQGMCNPKSAVSYAELMKNLERIADHCNNVAEAVLDREEL
jgi:phosphate:Na+ symporter